MNNISTHISVCIPRYKYSYNCNITYFLLLYVSVFYNCMYPCFIIVCVIIFDTLNEYYFK